EHREKDEREESGGEEPDPSLAAGTEAEQKRRAANIRKIFLAMARDVRVMIVKLADRVHNMQTLGALPAARRRRIAQETLQIYDLVAVRIIVHTISDCYYALGVVHDLWLPIQSMFSDYIARPKSNMYQSLHTKVIGPRGEPLEIQIRTWDMHRTADFGIAAHWQYKEGGRPDRRFEEKLAWLRQQLFA